VPTRAFNGGTAADRIVTSAGNSPASQGPITIAGLVKITSGFAGTAWMVDADDATFVKWGMLLSGGVLFYENDFTSGGPTPPNGVWAWIVGSKGVGNVTPRWHIKNVTSGGAWTHANGSGNVNDLSGTATEIIIGGQFTGGAGTTWRGSIAALASWRKVLTDLQVEAWCSSLAKDLRLGEPAWGTLLNQASTATSVVDFTGGGGNQTSLSGTSVDSDVPPGFDFTLPTVEHLFTTEVPSGANFFENAPTTLATTLGFLTAGYVTGARFFAPTNPQGVYELVLYQATHEDPGGGTGTVIASKVVDQTVLAGKWNAIAFDAPVAVTTGVGYRIALRSSVGSYAATNNFFASGDLVTGNLLAPQTNVLHSQLGGSYANGTFAGDITSYPTGTFNATCYFVDVSFVAGTAPAGGNPAGLPIPVAVGQPTASLGLSTSPSGLAVPVAVGQPAAALGLVAAPAGLAIPVALGQPSVGPAGASPLGVAIPVGLGQPAAALGRVASPAGLAIPVAIGQPSPNLPVATEGRSWPIVATTSGRPIVTTTNGRRLTA
jgi:hypothetical protein